MKTSFITKTTVLAFLAVTKQVQAEDTIPILTLNDDSSFNFDILSALQQMISSSADINPVLSAALTIKAGDWDSFIDSWTDLANDTKTSALSLVDDSDPVNLRDTWFAVANYFRKADAYNRANWSDPRINEFWYEQRSAFDKAIATLPVPGERAQVPTKDFKIETIWYGQPKDSHGPKRKKTLILGQGFDAAQEDLYATHVAPALARGWNVLSYEGPGQPTVRRDQDLGFIYDWERVVTPVIDYVLKEKAHDVDTDQLALFGNSFGGYLDARAAAFEPRIKALMLDGGIWDSYDGYTKLLPSDMYKLLEAGKKKEFDQAAADLQNDPDISTSVKWGILQGTWAFNTHSPYEFLKMTKNYTLKGGIAEKIKMPVWIGDGEYDTFFPGQSQQVKDALGDQAELHTFMGSAGAHCQTGAPQELQRVMFAWLDKTFSK